MADRPKPSKLRHLPFLVILCVAVIGAFTLREYLSFETLHDNREVLLTFRDQNFALMILGFAAIYVLIVSFSLPGAGVATVTAGFLFGFLTGTAISIVSATLGASVIFLAARWGLGSALSAKLEASEGTMFQIRNGLRDNEISVLFLLRLVPAVPFFVANLLPALVGVKFRNFFWTTALGIIPGSTVFAWIGVGLGEVFDRGESPDLSLLWEPQIIGPILGVSALAALPIVIKVIRGRKETKRDE